MWKEFIDTLLLLNVYDVYKYWPTVRHTANGPVAGIQQTSSLGQEYYAFKGVPYAEPPITGKDKYTDEYVDRRFKAPVPLQRKWATPLHVFTTPPPCIPCGGPPPRHMSEDCLYLNIFVPEGGRKSKTVLVWMFGGVFNMGDSNEMTYGPDFLLSEDNIVVTLNYRVGIFGFLNLGVGEYTGNMGLKDQQLALEWIYKNIEQFSGNKDEILIFGESAGGASVSFHMLNERSRQYFTRSLAISSSSLSFYALSEGNKTKQVQDCFKIYEMDQLISHLKTMSYTDGQKCHSYQPGNDRSITWVPTIESPDVVGAFLTKTPEEIYASDNAPVLDAMFSFNSKEYMTFRPDLIKSKEPLIPEDVSQTNPDIIQLPFRGFTKQAHPEAYEKSLKILRKAYFPNPEDSAAVALGNIQLMSDLTFSESVLRNAVYQTIANNKGTKKNTFIYRFSLDAEFFLIQHMTKDKFNGAGHGDDVCYVFHCHIMDPKYRRHLENKDESFKKIMRSVKLITNFARTGNPSIEGDTPFKNCESEDEIYAQEVGNNQETSVIENIKEQEHYDAWREVEAIYRKSIKM